MEIYELLYRLGVTANYTGFFYTAYAVQLCAEHPDRLMLVTKWVYPDVAKRYRTNWKAVERNIRTAGNVIWEEGRSHLEQLAGRILEHKPCNAQLLAILSYSLLLPRATRLTARRLDEAVALSREDHDMGVVDESANERDDEPVVPKDCVPLDELQVK